MADSLPDSRGGGEAGVAGARTNGPPGGEEAQQQQKKEEATLNPGADAAPSSGQQNECGGTNQHPAGAGGVVPAGGEGGDTDGQQNECGGASECPPGAGSVVQTVKERMDKGSLVVVQNNSENTNNSEPSMTQGELSQGSDETRPALTNMAPAGRGTEDTGDPVAEQNNSEGAGSESSKAHGELSQGTDESKLEKVSVSQAKDPPDRNTPATQEAVIAGAGAPPASVAAVTVSTNPPESLPPLPDNTSNLAGPEQLASGPPAPPPSTEGSAMPSFSVDPLSSVSSDGALQAAAKEQASPKASSPLPAPEAAGAEGSSSESSQLSSVPMESDSCSEVAVGVLRSIVPEEAGGTMAAVSVSQHEDRAASGTQLPVNECPSRVSKSQTDATGGSACAVTDAEKNRTQSEAAAMQENMAGQSGEPMEVSENWDDRNFTCEADTETLPLIVATHSLSHKESTEKAPSKAVESTAAAEVNGGAKKAVPLLVTEPLRPVTIGSSLQPLEELQEATAEEEAPSFTADLAIMDSSADEADSIGGLVINNVIGAADGVVDFQPDEVEAEKELMDISSSAPQITDTTEDDGPSAKRRRLENGTSEGEDRTEEPRTVILKLIPVKNGHGVWDSRKLLEVLSAKGTIMLQVHASKENLELCEADKTEAEKTVDFSAIMTAIKDEDHDPVLSCSSGGGEAESDDPLAIGTSSETNTQPSFARSFPPPQGRSTALQPAIPPRPTFKHLQIPQHYYMRNEVLGLPPPLEFEEPQGSADMSGLDTHSVAFPGPQATAPSPLPLTPGVASEMSRRAQVCGECGKEFFNPLSYNMHVRTHQPWIECDKCPFRTKLAQKLKWHELIHRRNPGFKCFTCKKSFTRIEGLLVHQKKLHHIHQCKYCGTVWRENESLRIHLQEVYSKDGSLPSCWVKNHGETIPDVPQTTETDESQAASTLHQTAGRGTREVQMAQHVDVPDFSKVLVKEEKESFENSEPSPAGPALPDALGTGESAQQCVQVANTLSAPLTTLSSSSAFPAGNAFLTYNPVSQSLQLISPHFILQQQQPRHEKGKGNLATPSPLLPQCVPSVQALASSPTIATFKPIVSSAPNLTPAPQDAQVPDVTPSTSIESDSQAGAESVTLIQQRDKDGKNIGTLFRCKLCPHVFLTAGDFEEHFHSAHPEEPFLQFPISWLKKRQNIQQPKVNMFKPKAPRTKLRLPCDACTEVFTTYRGLAKHKKLKHKKAYTCPVCSIVMRSNYRLMRHQKMMHKDKLRCRYFCGMLCDTYEDLLSHYKIVHKKNPTNQECPHCQRSFIYEGFLMNHLDKCAQCPPDKRPAHVCGNCDGFFPNIEAYNEHALICLTPSKERSNFEAPSTSLGKRKTQLFELENETNEPGEITTVILEDEDERDDVDLDAGKEIMDDVELDAGKEIRDDLELDAGKEISDEDFPDIDAPRASSVKQRPPSGDHKMCRYCPDVFLKKANAITHILYSHSDIAKRMIVAPLKCDMCGIVFKNPTCLCKHLMKHYTRLNQWDAFVPRDILKTVKVRGYCWICNTHQDGLKGSHVMQRDRVIDETVDIEELINTDIEPLECDECKELFPTRKLFWHHVKKHLAKLPLEVVHYGDFQGDGKSFQCRKCSFKCSDREGLYEHIADHFLVRYEDVNQESKEAEEKLEDGKTGSAEARVKGDAEASGEKGVEDREKGDIMEVDAKGDMGTSVKGDGEGSGERETEDREKSDMETSKKGDREATGKDDSEDGKNNDSKESENNDVKDGENDGMEDSEGDNVEDSDIDDVEVISHQEGDSDSMDITECDN